MENKPSKAIAQITIGIDNTSDLGEDLYKKYNLQVIYFGVVIGSELFIDKHVTPDDIYKAVEKDGILPKTNAALEMDYKELFIKATANGGSIIHFSMSDKMSISHQNALRAAKGMERVHVINTKSACAGTGILAIKASELRDQGKTVEEILETIKPMVDKLNVGFIIKDLNYLYRGGRASGLKLLGANLLKIRPSLIVNKEGKIVPDKKFKGQFESTVKEWTQFKIEQASNANKELAFVVHSDIDDSIVTGVINSLKGAGFKDVGRIVVGTALTIHVGRNALGVIFMEN
ncbi:MAG: DegV family protein [Firmicutes bacterium]|nr:DegV family protein [Bacillota bacterium]